MLSENDRPRADATHDDTRGAVEESFRTFVRSRREAMALSQAELARRLSEHGLSFIQSQIQKIESGARPVSLAEAVALIRILGGTLQQAIEPQVDDLEGLELEAEIAAANVWIARLRADLIKLAKDVEVAEMQMLQVEARRQSLVARRRELRPDASAGIERLIAERVDAVQRVLGDRAEHDERLSALLAVNRSLVEEEAAQRGEHQETT